MSHFKFYSARLYMTSNGVNTCFLRVKFIKINLHNWHADINKIIEICLNTSISINSKDPHGSTKIDSACYLSSDRSGGI